MNDKIHKIIDVNDNHPGETNLPKMMEKGRREGMSDENLDDDGAKSKHFGLIAMEKDHLSTTSSHM